MASQALIKDFEDMIGKENVFSSEADRAKEFKADFVDFLRNCNGFRTY